MHPIVVSRVCDFHPVSISKLDSKLEIKNKQHVSKWLGMCFRPLLILRTQFPKLTAMVVSKIIRGVEGKKLSSSWSLSAYRLFRNFETFIKVTLIWILNSYETSTHTHVVFEGTSTSMILLVEKKSKTTTWDGAKKTLKKCLWYSHIFTYMSWCRISSINSIIAPRWDASLTLRAFLGRFFSTLRGRDHCFTDQAR